MGIVDIAILAMVFAALALAIRSIAHGGADCSGCASRSTCHARETGGKCEVAQDMIARANAAFAQAGENSATK